LIRAASILPVVKKAAFITVSLVVAVAVVGELQRSDVTRGTAPQSTMAAGETLIFPYDQRQRADAFRRALISLELDPVGESESTNDKAE
jgi:hypothetical protein